MAETQSDPELDAGARSGLVRYFAAHPLVGLAGALCSVIGIPLAVIFFLLAQREPQLRYAVSEARSVIPLRDVPEGLRCTFEGTPIEDDVVGVEVMLWNSGRAPVHGNRCAVKNSDILEPFRIEFDTPVRIVHASIAEQTREVVDAAILPSLLFPAEVSSVIVEWSILERGDGAKLGITYAGSTTAGLRLVGTIEGQGSPKQVNLDSRSVTDSIVVTILGALLSWKILYDIRGLARRRERWSSTAIGIAIGTCLALGSLWMVYVGTMGGIDALSHPF